MKTSIHYSEEICKRLEAKKLTETISAYAMEYIMAIMLAIFSTGYHGKTVDAENRFYASLMIRSHPKQNRHQRQCIQSKQQIFTFPI